MIVSDATRLRQYYDCCIAPIIQSIYLHKVKLKLIKWLFTKFYLLISQTRRLLPQPSILIEAEKHYGKIRRSLDSFDALSLDRVTVFEIKIFGV